MKNLVVGWKVSTLNPDLASLRYRALLPMLSLEQFGVKHRIISRPSRNCLLGLDALVIVKSFTYDDYWLAQEAASMELPVIFDLCDNIFIEQYRGKKNTSPADIFLLIANISSAVVVTTDPLADVVREKLNDRIPVYVVPDGIETIELLKAARRILRVPRICEFLLRALNDCRILKLFGILQLFKAGSPAGLLKKLVKDLKGVIRNASRNFSRFTAATNRLLHWRYWAKLLYRCFDHYRVKVRGSLSNAQSGSCFNKMEQIGNSKPDSTQESLQKRKKILWFGNHGASHASFGMLDLLYIRESLESVAAELPVELVVVSNSYDKYSKHIRPLAIPTRYLEWSAVSMATHFQDADVVVIPNSLDAFSVCKSSNRTVLALMHGVPVVATSTPSLDVLRECIVVDDFAGGIRRYLTDEDIARQHVEYGKRLIEQFYGQAVIGRLWREVINQAMTTNKAKPGGQAELVIALQLPQDVDLAIPVVEEAVRRGVSVALWTSLSALSRWPQLAKAIRDTGMPWRVLPDDLQWVEANVFSGATRGLLAITETNLNPHGFTHQLTKIANGAGLHTATIQHGYENVGLSYSDDIHDIRQVRFASRQIFIWGHLETLHPEITPQTFHKCFPVGCPKPVHVPPVHIDGWHKTGRALVGIFENLHWHRYQDEYREFFLDGVMSMVHAFPDIDFLVKPHDAGMWLTSRYNGNRLQADNLIIVDPKDPQWAGITAPQLFSHLISVITTPSTVALDAARAAIPVAVVANDMHLDNYDPLPLIHNKEDWVRFITQTIAPSNREALQKKASEFVSKAILPGNAAWRIVEEMMSHKHRRQRHVA